MYEALLSPVDTSPRLLIIDDENEITEMLQNFFRHRGYPHVMVTQTGAQALAFAQEHTFDVVITDLSMQGMDGLALAKRLKERVLTGHVMLLTGWGHAPDAQGQLPDHVDQLLAKPPRLSALRWALGQVPRTR